MRVLYVGFLRNGSTTLARMRALQELDFEMLSFDISCYAEVGTRFERSAMARFNFGRGIKNLNHDLLAFARRNTYDVVWIDKGVWIFPQTLVELREFSKRTFAVHYTPDPQICFHNSRYFFGCIPHYDVLATTKSFEIEGYRSKGAREIVLTLQGFSSSAVATGAAANTSVDLTSDVCFIGHYERHYALRVKAAALTKSQVKVWGPKWPRYARFNNWACGIVQGNGIWDDQYLLGLQSTKIALGLLSKWIPETTTTRTFEIPAIGTFLLAERNDDHLGLFDEGKEAEFFSSDEELCDKIKYYLTNDEIRRRIARAGQERCLKSGYSTIHQIRRVVEYLPDGKSHLRRNVAFAI